MPPWHGSSDVGPFKKMGPFGFFGFLNNFVNFQPLVYINLFSAAVTVSCKALHKGF